MPFLKRPNNIGEVYIDQTLLANGPSYTDIGEAEAEIQRVVYGSSKNNYKGFGWRIREINPIFLTENIDENVLKLLRITEWKNLKSP